MGINLEKQIENGVKLKETLICNGSNHELLPFFARFVNWIHSISIKFCEIRDIISDRFSCSFMAFNPELMIMTHNLMNYCDIEPRNMCQLLGTFGMWLHGV